MKKIASTIGCAVVLTGTAFAQGTVDWAGVGSFFIGQTNSTVYSTFAGSGGPTGSGSAGNTIGNNAANNAALGYNGYYYELLVSTTASAAPAMVAGLGSWSDTGLMATNGAASNGRIIQTAVGGVPNNTIAPANNWPANTAANVVMVGWSANLGTNWTTVLNELQNWDVAKESITGPAYFGVSSTGTNLVSGTGSPGVAVFGLGTGQINNGAADPMQMDLLQTVPTNPTNGFPFFVTQPQSQTVLAGSNVTFSAAADGSPPLVFQWYFNGSPIGGPVAGTNFTSYTLNNVGSNQMGNYTVLVVNGYGSALSCTSALIVSLPPVITAQPASQTNAANTTATFSVAVSSLSALSYQWQQNGTNLTNGGEFSGVTTNTLTITGVSSNDAAIYSVAVTNLAGGVLSSNAVLAVVYPPVFMAQPLSQRLVMGNGVSFSVAVSGTAPFNYQWRFNSMNLLNATNAVYAIPAVGTNNTGNYSVVVTNLAGSVTSSNALLVVLVPPSLALQLWAGYPLLNLSGMLSNNFVVQYNTNLTGANWITLLSLSNLLTSPYLFLDPAGVVPPSRYYRAVMQ